MNKSLNIWFHGGAYACVWSFGFATEVKRLGIKTNFVGGYSAGALVAAYMLNLEHCEIRANNSMIKYTCSPFNNIFGIFSSHINIVPMVEEGSIYHPSFFNASHFNGKLWIPIRGIKSLMGTWRNSWRDYDDLSECLQATTCIPIFYRKLTTCYYDDTGSRRGPTIDGGIFSREPPKIWNRSKTLIVSPWGTGDLNMNPCAKLSDLAFPKKVNLKTHFNLGVQQAREYFDKANI